MPSRYWSAAVTVALGAGLLSVIAWGLLTMLQSKHAFYASPLSISFAYPPAVMKLRPQAA